MIKNYNVYQALMKKSIKEIEEQLEDAQDKQTKEFPKIKSTIYQQKHQILKRNITITDSDGEKLLSKARM